MPALTIQNIPDLYPELMAEYNRVSTIGDPKLDRNGKPVLDKRGNPVMVKFKGSWEKWAADHSKVQPNWVAEANNEFQKRMRDDVDFRMERMKFTKDTLAEIEEFFPEAVAQYESLKNNRKIKDKSFLDYAQRMVKSDPSWLPSVNAQYRNVVTNEIDSSLLELRKNPEFSKLPEATQRSLASRVVTGGISDAVNYARRDPTINSDPEIMAWVDRAEREARYGEMSAEEKFFEQTMTDYVEPDLARDAQRRQEADKLMQDYQGAFDASRGLVNDLTKVDPTTGGSLLYSRELSQNQAAREEQLANLGEQTSAMGDNLVAQVDMLGRGLATLNKDQQAALAKELNSRRSALEAQLSTMGTAITAQDAARKAALETQLGELNTAQNKVDAARMASARSQGVAINLGAQSAMDATRAQMAAQGFVGGSSGSDMALGRSLIQARQGAAQALGDAGLENALDRQKISTYGADTRFGISDRTAGMKFDLSNFGATETRGLSDYGAEQTRGLQTTDAQNRFGLTQFAAGETRKLGDFGATETRGIKDAATQRGLDYFDRDNARRIAALSLPAQAVQQELQVKNLADNYAQSGLTRAQNNLNWFNIGPSQAPNAVTSSVTPNTAMGEAFQNLGAGITGAAANYGLAKLYQSGAKTPTATPTPSASSFDTAFRGNFSGFNTPTGGADLRFNLGTSP